MGTAGPKWSASTRRRRVRYSSLSNAAAGVTDLMLGFAWIVGITNAVNLLDNMDGLAAGVGAIATQSFVDPSYGKLGLELMRTGKSAPERDAATAAAVSRRWRRAITSR